MPIQRIQMRRGTTAEWTAENPQLAAGEFGYDLTVDGIKIGDGVQPWLDLPWLVTGNQMFVNARDYGALGLGGDYSAELNDAIAAAVDLAAASPVGGGVTVFVPPGYYRAKNVHLPDFTSTELPWSINRPFTLMGAGRALTTVQLSADTTLARYIFGHPSVGETTNRGQNVFQSVGDMMLVGPQDRTKNIPCLAVSNSYKGYYYRLHLEGCPGGPAIHNYAHGNGGSEDNIWDQLGTWRGSWDPSPTNEKRTLMSDLTTHAVRYLIRLDGPMSSNGKCNDNEIRNPTVFNVLQGVIDTRGHGAPGGGGCDNPTLVGGFCNSKNVDEVEHGPLSAATSTTVMNLRTDAGEVLNDTPGVYNDCALRIKDPATGLWHSRWINTYTAGTREIVLDSALPFLPVAGDEYYIRYGDAIARADGWSADVDPHGILWDSVDYFARISRARFEGIRPVVATVGSNTDVNMEFAHEVATNGRAGSYTDGTAWRPRLWITDRPRGSRTAPSHMQIATITLGDAASSTPKVATLIRKVNDTGGTVVNGAVVSIKNSIQNVGNAGGTSVLKHAVVYNPGVSSWRQGEALTIAANGEVDVRVDTTAVAVVAGDYIVPAASNLGAPVGPGVITLVQLTRAVARALEDKPSGGGIVNVRCAVKPV